MPDSNDSDGEDALPRDHTLNSIPQQNASRPQPPTQRKASLWIGDCHCVSRTSELTWEEKMANLGRFVELLRDGFWGKLGFADDEHPDDVSEQERLPAPRRRMCSEDLFSRERNPQRATDSEPSTPREGDAVDAASPRVMEADTSGETRPVFLQKTGGSSASLLQGGTYAEDVNDEGGDPDSPLAARWKTLRQNTRGVRVLTPRSEDPSR
eukprot:TRINITY_DN80264_c0_g1_i1.p1 TRINITY_DN80264_c0_g1~~TRINITY_DN80264_c0_g1_i1.p1  ORF type:complete len:210 (+),score=20.91 TRINITY_DN80264_c0_g1_i1:158-787(+)